MNRHLISAGDLTRDDALLILDTADELAHVSERPIKKLPTLRGRTVVNLFFEDSTRTRISFEAAAKRLSADVINFSAKGSSVAKGESLKDTALTLEAMGADAVVVRHSAAGTPHRLAKWVRGSIVNAGDGAHEHPTQALLDAFTIRRRLCPSHQGSGHASHAGQGHAGQGHVGQGHAGQGGRRGVGEGLDGLKVTIVGDILHSRVARSNVLLLSTLGAEVTLIAPPTLLPNEVGGWPCATGYDLDVALPKTDVVMMLRVQRERMNAAYFPSEREYSRRYGLDAARMALLPEHAIVMHPGPMNRGIEIAAEVADSARSTIVEQVANGVSVRMAVLYLLLGGHEPAQAAPAQTAQALAGPVQTGRGQAGREQAGQGHAGREQPGRERAEREQAGQGHATGVGG
jgi:aspartate carbamoyltransferase catalytic subunit